MQGEAETLMDEPELQEAAPMIGLRCDGEAPAGLLIARAEGAEAPPAFIGVGQAVELTAVTATDCTAPVEAPRWSVPTRPSRLVNASATPTPPQTTFTIAGARTSASAQQGTTVRARSGSLTGEHTVRVCEVRCTDEKGNALPASLLPGLETRVRVTSDPPGVGRLEVTVEPAEVLVEPVDPATLPLIVRLRPALTWSGTIHLRCRLRAVPPAAGEVSRDVALPVEASPPDDPTLVWCARGDVKTLDDVAVAQWEHHHIALQAEWKPPRRTPRVVVFLTRSSGGAAEDVGWVVRDGHGPDASWPDLDLVQRALPNLGPVVRPPRPSAATAQRAALLAEAKQDRSGAGDGQCYRAFKINVKAAGGYGDLLDVYRDERFYRTDAQGSAIDFLAVVERNGLADLGLEELAWTEARAALMSAPAGAIVITQGHASGAHPTDCPANTPGGRCPISPEHGDIAVLEGVEGNTLVLWNYKKLVFSTKEEHWGASGKYHGLLRAIYVPRDRS